MPNFLMVSTGKEEAEGGLAPTGEIGYYRHDRHEILKLCNQIEAADLGLGTRSIPDTWAQLIKLQQSLLTFQSSSANGDPSKPFKELRAQWRGFLAFVVLRKEMNLQDQFQFTPAISGENPGSFTRVVRELLPDDLTLVDVGWKSIHLISFKGVTLGCTSPLTFVCPSATSPLTGRSSLTIPRCNWFVEGRFGDPTEKAESTYLQALLAWVQRTVQRLAPGAKDGADYLDAIRATQLRSELNSFATDIDGRLKASVRQDQGRLGKDDLRDEYDATFQTSGAVQESIRRLVSTPKGLTEAQIKNSPFLLLPASGASPKVPVILIHRTLTGHPSFEKGNIEMLRGVSLNRALEEYQLGNHGQISSLNVSPGAIYSADELFCEKIFVATVADGFPGAYELKGSKGLHKKETTAGLSPVLPLRSDFVEYFTPEYLRENVEFSCPESGPEEEITVSLIVSLGKSATPVKFSRTYRAKDSEINTGRPPELKIWPDFDQTVLTGWKTWYAYYNDLSVSKLHVAPRAEYCVPPSEDDVDKPVHSKIVDSIDKLKLVEIHRCSTFPAIFECRFGGKMVGVILAKPNESKKDEVSGDWEVSIDFGTTGTSVFFRHDGEIENLPLDPHLLQVTNVPGSIPENYRFFLPKDDGNRDGMLSIFKQFAASLTDIRGISVPINDITPYLGGHISFIERSADLAQNKNLEAQGVYADMKWGTADEQSRGKAFLRQLCLLTALQAKVAGAESIRWVFSYPLSFSRSRYDNFRAVWRNCVRFALDFSGLAPTDPKILFRVRDESTCAAKFAQKRHHADIRGGAIILDIGGGSTDISVWANPGRLETKCVRNTSVKFAGRDIFQRPLNRKRDILKHFVKEEFVKNLPSSQDKETLFFSQIDSLFKLQSEDLFRLLDSKHAEDEVKRFIGILSIGMRGLFFYTGTVLKELVKQKALDNNILPDVFVCGNGGKILHWLNYGGFEAGSEVEKRLIHVLRMGGGFPVEAGEDVARITLSQKPKTEAAYGMLVDPDENSNGIENQPNEVLGGEFYKLGHEAFDPLDLVPFEKLRDMAFVVDSDLPCITAFLEASGQRKLHPRTQKVIVGRTNEKLAAIAKKRKERKADDSDSQAELEQPIFIIALNELIQQAAEDWAKGAEAWWL